MTAEHTSDNLPTPEERLRLVLADAPAGTWAIGVAIDLLIAAADDLGRLRRERAAALESVVWRANWMARATAAISALMDELDPDTEDPSGPSWSSSKPRNSTTETRRTTMSDHSEQSVPPTWPAPRQEDRIWTPSGICIDAWCDHDDFCPGPVVPRG